MDIFDSHYYKVNTAGLKRIGLWPHDDALNNKVKQTTVIAIAVSIIIPQTIRLVEEWNRDIDIVIEVIGSLIYFSGSQIKFISFILVQSKMKFLYEEIAKHWQILNSEREQKILQQFGEQGRFITFLYLIPINLALAVYITVPLSPILLDIIDPLNYTRHRVFPYFAEFFIDDQKYYFQLTIHCWIVCILSVQIYGTFDTAYAQCVQHSRALFAIVEYRLDRTMKLQINTQNLAHRKRNDDKVYDEMTEAIWLHKQAIQFVDLIEQSYTNAYFWILLLNSTLLSLTAVDTMLNLEKGNYKQMIRIGTVYIGFSIHLLFNMSPGQMLIDSSSKVHDAAFHCEWFNTSARTKRLISLMMMRTIVPCSFTARKLCLLNLETFSFVFNKSLSYVTVIASMR